jgi:ATP-binding cassette, subfamily B, bacterial
MLSGWVIDELRKGSGASVKYVATIAFIIFLTDLFSNLFSNISGFLGDRMAFKLQKILSEGYYSHLLMLPQRYFDTELTGKIIARLERSIQQISDFMNMLSNNFLQFLFSTLFALVIVSRYSWQVALMLASLYPIYILLTARTSGKWLQYQATINEHKDIAAGRFAEVIGQIKVVKSFRQELHELNYFSKHQREIIDVERPQSILWHTNDVRRRLVLNGIFFAVYLYVFVQAAHGAFTPGQAVALILYAMQIRIPVFTISFLVDRTQRVIGDSRDYFAIMDIQPEIEDHKGAKQLMVKHGEIVFDNVSFSYDGKQPVLKNISLTFRPDSKVALVGESGEGKTTLTNLLLRLYEPNEGVISIDGQDINEVAQISLRHNIGVVFQDPALFSGTIRENISYANPKATDKEIIAAAKAANADEFVAKLEKGYDTEIGERGLKLSGGQKQRIAIARALLKDAPILILDEATSSLDSKSEAMVQEALGRLMKGRTTIIIAHRLSTIQHVNTIVTLLGGKIDEIGSPVELAKSGGIYAQLLELQHGKKTETTKKKLQEFEIAG